MQIALPNLPVIEREIGTHENYQTDFRLNLSLYTGGRISGNIDLSKAAQEMYAALESADQDKLAYQTRAEYFGLYRAIELYKVAQASLKRAEVITNNVRSLYEAGAADSVAVLDARLALSRATLAVSQAETNRRVSEIRLLTLVGLPLADSLSLVSKPTEPTEQSLEAVVSEQKAELRAADASVRMASARMRLTKADYFPTIATYGGYSYGKPNLDRFGNSWNDYFTVGASLNWSFNIGGKAANRARSSAYNLESSRQERNQVAENLTREANLSAEQLSIAYTRYQNSLTEYQISSAQYRIAEQQHADGVLSSNRLLEIEADLTASEAGMAASLIDYYITQSGFYYITGSENLKKGI
jgi:outer membrane protein TolC